MFSLKDLIKMIKMNCGKITELFLLELKSFFSVLFSKVSRNEKAGAYFFANILSSFDFFFFA